MTDAFVPVDQPEIVPGRVSVVVSDCSIANTGPWAGARAWVYATQGLEPAGQREIVLALLNDGGGRGRRGFPDFPLTLLARIAAFAEDGAIVEAGGRTVLGAPGVSPGVGRGGRIGGLLYVPCPGPGMGGPVPGLELNRYRRAPLLALPVTPREAVAADRFGHTRVLIALGARMRLYPHPWWFDGRGESVIDVESHEETSILARTDRAHAAYVEVVRTGARLEMTLAQEDAPRLLALLQRAPDAFALLTGVPPNALLTPVWRPGDGPRAAVYAGSRVPDGTPPDHRRHPVGGAFLVLAHGNVEASAADVEDGFAVTLPRKHWQRLVWAVGERAAFTCAVGSGTGIAEFALGWISRRHASLSGETVHADGGFRSQGGVAPAVAGVRGPHHVEVRRIVLLTGEVDLRMAVSADAIAGYVRALAAALDEEVGAAGRRLPETVAEFWLPADGLRGPVVMIDHEAAARAGFHGTRLATCLRGVDVPVVRHVEVRFQVVFAGRGGRGGTASGTAGGGVPAGDGSFPA